MNATLAVALDLARPALLLGLLAVALPILVHLLLRPKPQRVRFPAIALLWPALLSGQRAGRVRNAALLACRIAVLALAALLLAGPTCAGPGTHAAQRGPRAAVLLIDDSASMFYVTESGESLLEVARRDALQRLDEYQAGGLTDVAILHTGDAVGAENVLESPRAARRRVRPAPPSPTHARTLAAALRDAARILTSATQADRQLVVYTDLTERAWSDVSSATLADATGVVVEIVAVADDAARTNTGLHAIRVPTPFAPSDVSSSAAAEIRNAGPSGECWLAAETDSGTLARTGPLQLAADQGLNELIGLPPLPPGPHPLAVRLEPADRLDFDQERFATFESGPRPGVWMITPPVSAENTEITSLILRNLLAPAALAEAAQPLRLSEVNPAGPAPAGEPPALVVAIAGTPMSAPVARELLARLESGATLLLVPRGGPDGADWPGLRPLLTAVAPRVRERSAATTLTWDRASPYAQPPTAPANLAGVGVRASVELDGLSQSAVTHARFADGMPAIVSKPVGRGRLVVLTTSPDPEWSDYGIEAAALLTWLHDLVAEAVGPRAAVAEFHIEELAERPFAALPPAGRVRVVGPRGAASTATWVTLEEGRPTPAWPTGAAGIYAVYAGNASSPACFYAVNWPSAESDLSPITVEKIEQRIGLAAAVTRIDGARAGDDSAAGGAWPGDIRAWIAALLLGVLLTEGWMADRVGRLRGR